MKKIILAIIIIAFSASVNAISFGVQTTICSPQWYCSPFSGSSCGSRTCTDINACGVNTNKPVEFLQCPISSGSGGGGSGNSGYYPNNANNTNADIYPQGYFTLSADIVQTSLVSGEDFQKVLSIKTYSASSLTVSISYPDDYNQSASFLSASPDKLSLASGDSSNIAVMVDSHNILPGIYFAVLHISNDYYSRNVTIMTTVLPQSRDFLAVVLSINTGINEIIKSKIINFSIHIEPVISKSNINLSRFSINYNIFNSEGNIILNSSRKLNGYDWDTSNIIELPSDIPPGYYALTTIVTNGTYLAFDHKVFDIMPENYLPVQEQPMQIIDINYLFYIGIIIAIFAVAAIVFSARGYSKRLSEKDFERDRDLALVSKSFNQGFITKEELDAIVKSINARYELHNIKASSNDKTDVKADIKSNSIEHDIIYPMANDVDIKSDHALSIKPDQNIVVEPNPQPAGIIQKENMNKEFTIRCADEKSFILNDGKKLFCVNDLLECSYSMTQETFEHHANNSRNDFANWIYDVFGFKDLANAVRKATNRAELILILNDFKSG